MSVIRDIYHDVKNSKHLSKPFELHYNRTSNQLILSIDGEISTSIAEYPQLSYLVKMDNDWGSFYGEVRRIEKIILRDIARSMKKHVKYYRDIPIDTIVNYAYTSEIPK